MKFKFNYYHIIILVLFIVVIKKVYENYISSSQGSFDLFKDQYIPMRNHFVPLGRMDDEMLHNPKHYG